MRLALLCTILGTALAAHAFTYEDLIALIHTEKVSHLEDLLPKLPENFRAEFALVHATHSRQDADPDHPRVILFGSDAQLTCAFNGGDPKLSGHDTLECFQFRKAERKFDFREIQFPTVQNGLNAPKFSESGFSADGKTACARCHGADHRPNWAEYPDWPGVYGQSDGASSPEEESKYEKFRELAEKNPRYRNLDLPRFRDYLLRHSNIRFGDLAGRMNAGRINRLARAKLGDWELLAFAISGLECPLEEHDRDVLHGINENYREDIEPKNLFAKIGISTRDWTLRLEGEPSTISSRQPFDHQTGYGRQLVSFAMAEIGQRAQAQAEGAPLKSAFAKVLATRRPPSDRQRVAPEVLDAILPGIDFYDDEFGNARAQLCAPLFDLFKASYQTARSHR